MGKRRVFQVAKEYHISSDALISMLVDMDFKVKNHMSVIDDQMYDEIRNRFVTEQQNAVKPHEIEQEEKRDVKLDIKQDVVIEKDMEKHAETGERAEPVVPERVKADHADSPAVSTGSAPAKASAEISASHPAKNVTDVSPKKAPESHVIPPRGAAQEAANANIASTPSGNAAPGGKPASDGSAGSVGHSTSAGPSKRKRKKKRPKPDSEAQQASQNGKPAIKHKTPPAQNAQPAHADRKVQTDASKKPRSKSHKRKKKVDMAAVQDSYKKTLASISSDTRKSKKYRHKHTPQDTPEDDKNVVKVSEFVSVAELANQMGVPANNLIAKCLELGTLVSINQRLDMATISLLAESFGFEVEALGEYAEDVFKTREIEEEDEERLFPRPPVVTVMGHVDHGKTTLLDHIRKTNVVGGESGGITQHIGAYSVNHKRGHISFIDTPGHQAFTAMRARGAQVTDIVILVVAADDSVMPQTIEAIDHAKAAGVPIVIAINKIDLPGADPEKIRTDLARHNILVEDWGGPYQSQEISAKNGLNIEKLLEKVLLEAEVLELKADPDKKATGVVIDSKLDRGRGALATILVQSGSLRVGDPFITGMITGRVRAMFNEFGERVDSVGPSQPALILGMDGVPRAGDSFYSVDSEVEAREIAQRRRIMKREQDSRRLKRITLSDLYDHIKEGMIKELNLIIKADVDGSVEALSDSLSQITHPEVRIRVIHQGVGGINENDVLLAAASGAIIIGFHVRPSVQARSLAETEDVEIKKYEIIYEVLEDVRNALSGLLAPKVTEKVIGVAEIRDVFKVPRRGYIAGCYITSGTIKRSSGVRVVRDNVEVYSGKILSLRRFKDDVSEVNQGYECGIAIENFDDVKTGDTIEAIEFVEEARSL